MKSNNKIPLSLDNSNSCIVIPSEKLRPDQAQLLWESWLLFDDQLNKWFLSTHFLNALFTAFNLPEPKTPEQIEAEEDEKAWIEHAKPVLSLLDKDGGSDKFNFIAGRKSYREQVKKIKIAK